MDQKQNSEKSERHLKSKMSDLLRFKKQLQFENSFPVNILCSNPKMVVKLA